MDNEPNTFPSKSYAVSGKIMLISIIILFSMLLFMILLHLFARWYLRRPNVTATRRRRHTHIIFYASGPEENTPRGLAASVLASLPVIKYFPGLEFPIMECAVCLSEFEDGEKVRLLPKCGHGFHVDCIDMWFHSHATCPICRSTVEKLNFKLNLRHHVNPGVCSSCHNPTCQSLDQEIDVESGNIEATSSSKFNVLSPLSRSPKEKFNASKGFSGRVETGSSSGSCATCPSFRSPGDEVNVELELSSRVETGSCASCHSASSLGDKRKEWRNGRVRIDVPKRTEFETVLEASSPASQRFWSPANQLRRILSMGRRSPIISPMGRPHREPSEFDLESGVYESSQTRNQARTPR